MITFRYKDYAEYTSPEAAVKYDGLISVGKDIGLLILFNYQGTFLLAFRCICIL